MSDLTDFSNGTRIEAAVIRNDSILLIYRNHNGDEYFVLPGGGWEPPETPEEGVLREVYEETSIEVKVDRIIFDLVVANDSRKTVYLCQYVKGEPELGNFNEKFAMEKDPSDIYKPLWFPLEKLKDARLYTLEFKDWFLENYRNGKLPNEVEKRIIQLSEFRQE